MPVLRNHRHERFAQNIVTSAKTKWSNGRCYSEAGFRTDDRSADACAARLLTKANVMQRIEELLAPSVKRTRTTVDVLAEQFDAVFNGAINAEQFGAAGSAAGLKAKLLGFMREKIEIGGPGSFMGETVDEVIDDAIEEFGSSGSLASSLRELADLVEQRAGLAARNVTPRNKTVQVRCRLPMPTNSRFR
ncbi:hypothetical protein [Bradyrhizobium sp. WSM471]|uniref:hypothetical protein n=1 Tax=Bradyrhizobium sp. WSM471 TaxID=319017 RepID=UPI00024D2DA3|nr:MULTISPECIES: hypothetical protein [Bradyrhizobium]EHR03234.1 Terminase small subunit [Bradyrhizobium sp. WSM471]UFW38461.1 hypothetical protein BcanWSM471_19640 [Bradyrhizobium canariense]